ncbi:retrovirus-related pol polyprotein from transposon TNT 1-94, partial [Tanacetum coccineum]
KLKGLWDEIDALEALYMCTCNSVYVNGRLNGARESRKSTQVSGQNCGFLTNDAVQGQCDPKLLDVGRYLFIAYYVSIHFKGMLKGNNQKIAHGVQSDGLYIILSEQDETSSPHPTFSNTPAVMSHSSNLHLWHARLGHPSTHVIKQIKQLSSFTTDVSKLHCTICPLSKQTALPFPISTSHASDLFDLIHVDTWGPYKHTTFNQCKYFLTIVDDHSRATWTYLLPAKHHIPTTIKSFFHYVKTQFNTNIKTLRSDNGTKFTNHSLSDFLKINRIVYQTLCPNTPQQNGRAERKHKHLPEVAISIHFQANFPIHLWGYSLMAATYLINRLPTKTLFTKSPYEALYKTPPDL